MKLTLTDFFDACSAEELKEMLGDLNEELEEGVDLERIRQMVSEKIVSTDSTKTKAKTAKTRRSYRKLTAAAAACLCLMIGTGAVVAEAHEYREAVDFFKENELPTEGLTRTEIKAVYRDIVTETYAYPKTAEVIQNGSPSEVTGMEIEQGNPDPEIISHGFYWDPASGSYGVVYLNDNAGSELQKFSGDELLWSVTLDGIRLTNWAVVSDGVFTWGEEFTNSTMLKTEWLFLVEDDGTLRWKMPFSHGSDWESITHILDNEDGTYAVFSATSTGSDWGTVMSLYTGTGEERMRKKLETGDMYGMANVARLGDDYLILLYDITSYEQRLVKMDRDGNFLDEDGFVYSTEEHDYHITNMAEFAGKLYLSANLVPKPAEGSRNTGRRTDVAALLDDVETYFAGKSVVKEQAYANSELLTRLRENFTAVLLVCDPVKGAPETFYSVKGCFGSKLNAQEKLTWDVESFTDASFYFREYPWDVDSGIDGRWEISAHGQVFRYAFDSTGTLLGQEKTQIVTFFNR